VISHGNKVIRLLVKLYAGHLCLFLCFHRLHKKFRRTNYLFQSRLLDDGEFAELNFVQKVTILMAFITVTILNCYFTYLLVWNQRQHCQSAEQAYQRCSKTYFVHDKKNFCRQNKIPVYDKHRGYFPKGTIFHYNSPANYNFTRPEDALLFTETSDLFLCFPYCSIHRINHEDEGHHKKESCQPNEMNDIWCAYPNKFLFFNCDSPFPTYGITCFFIFLGLLIFYPAKLISRIVISCANRKGGICSNRAGPLASFIISFVLTAYIAGICAVYFVLIGFDMILIIPPKQQYIQMLWRIAASLCGNFFLDWLVIHGVFIWKSYSLSDSIFSFPSSSSESENGR
jgi:hypothetical protein